MKLLTPVKFTEICTQPGQYSAKFILDPKRSQSIDRAEVIVRNADGQDICTEYKRWGTKLTLSFVIDDRTPDGVIIIEVQMSAKDERYRERFPVWVIK